MHLISVRPSRALLAASRAGAQHASDASVPGPLAGLSSSPGILPPIPINVLQRPFWDGVPKELGMWWTLRKNAHEAICRMFSHALGWELRLDVDGQMMRTAVCRSQEDVLDASQEWREAWRTKGWT
jgi:hypothetical protein